MQCTAFRRCPATRTPTLTPQLGLSSALSPAATLTTSKSVETPEISTTYKAPAKSIEVDGGKTTTTVKAASGAGEAAGAGFANAVGGGKAAGAKPPGTSP
jgi:hypothetical protein